MRAKIEHILANRKMPLVLAFLIPFFLTLGICIGHEIYPFGTQCFLHIDMYHQYAPFFTEFMNKLKEGSSLVYSWNLGLGTEFVPLMAYYLSSPLNWFVLLCPKGLVVEFMTLLIILKIGLCGLTFGYYLRSHYQDKGYKIILFSIFYALSGFICAYNWDIMWLDTVWLAPLIILGLERLVKQGKVTLYFVTLAVSILSNYYISIMICIFLVLYFLILITEQRRGRIKATLRFGFYSLLAGGCGAVLILPEIAALSNSGSGGITFPDKIEWYFGALDELARACIGVEVVPTTDHWPNIYCGVAVILFFLLYILNHEISFKQKWKRILLVVFFLVSFANNQLNFIWHGLHFPDGLPARQTFLYAFLLLVLSYEVLHHAKGCRLWHIIVALVLSEGLLLACYLFTDTTLVTVPSMLLSGIVILGYAMIFALYTGRDKGLRKMAIGFVFVLVCVEAGVNMDMTSVITTSRYTYYNNQDEYAALTSEAARADSSFYRTDKFNRLTKNESALTEYKSASIFSSLINADVADFYREIGMEGGKNYYCYNGATMLTSALLSVKYLMTDSAYEESPYRTLVGRDNGIYLYRNEYTLPLGFMMDSEVADNWDYELGTPITTQNHLASALGAKEDLLYELESEVRMHETIIHVEQSGYVYGYYTSKSVDSITATIGERVRKFTKCAHVYLLDFGYCEAGTDIKLTSYDAERIDVTGYELNDAAMQTAFDTLNQQTMTLDSYTDTSVKGHMEVTQAGNLILSIPNDAGWQVYVDGEAVEYESFCDAFISIPLTTGAHEIALTYTTPNLKYGILISTSCLAIFLVIAFCKRRNGGAEETIDDVEEKLVAEKFEPEYADLEELRQK